MTQRAVVICPGRGSYTRSELGTLEAWEALPGAEKRAEWLVRADEIRAAAGRPTISDLDGAERFRSATHMAGEHASGLTYVCSMLSATLLEEADVQVVAVCGNSMGWYTACALGGAMDFESGLRIVETTGGFQADRELGGQIILPVVDEAWRPDPERESVVADALASVADSGKGTAALSIRLGGYRVLAGDEPGLSRLLELLPETPGNGVTYPFRLARHAAFHTPIMTPMAEHALETLSDLRWTDPEISLVDGRGAIWRPRLAQPHELRNYTLWTQIVAPFDFTTSVRVALREFAPDRLILLGPGDSLGGAIGQILVDEGWGGIRSKSDFKERQKEDPVLLSLGREADRSRLLGG